MSPLADCLSFIFFAACVFPTFIFATPLAGPEDYANELDRRSNKYNVPCGNAQSISAGDKPNPSDINPPSQAEGPPLATNDSSGYFPYVWCLANTNTYVFIDPTGSYAYGNGTNQPIFAIGLNGTWTATQKAMTAQVNLGKHLPTGDTSIDDGGGASYMQTTVPVQNVPGVDDNTKVELFAQDANHQRLTYGIYASALTIITDFITTYPLYADTMYFQISDGRWGTVANGYMGLVTITEDGRSTCMLKQNATCSMPSNYPDS